MSLGPTLIATVAFLWAGPDPLREAQAEFQAALNPPSASRARAAIDRIVAVDTAAAVRSIAQAMAAIRQLEERVSREIEQKRRELERYTNDRPGTIDQTTWQLQRELTAKQGEYTELVSIRIALRSALPNFRSAEAAEEILGLLDSRDGEIAAAAALGLAAYPTGTMDGRILDMACRTFGRASDFGVKAALIDLIKSRRNVTDSVRDVLRRGLRDPAWQVVLASAQATRDLEARDLARDVIEALRNADRHLKAQLNRILVQMTGYDYRGDYDGWRTWWEQMGEAFVSGNYQRPEAGDGGGSGGTITFFGIPIESRRLIFVLDRSGSMNMPSGYRRAHITGETGLPVGFPREPEGNRKIDILRYEMRKVLTLLPDGTIFNIHAFNEYWTRFSEGLVMLNANTRARAIQWIQNLEPNGGTNLFDPTEAALQMAPEHAEDAHRLRGGIDTIIIFSDGQPNTGKIFEPAAIRRAIADLNQTRRVRIDTIFVGTRGEERFADFLKQIADDAEGSHARHLD